MNISMITPTVSILSHCDHRLWITPLGVFKNIYVIGEPKVSRAVMEQLTPDTEEEKMKTSHQ